MCIRDSDWDTAFSGSFFSNRQMLDELVVILFISILLMYFLSLIHISDIPVFYLNLTLKSDSAYGKVDERAFLDLCEFAENVIKRRIEQLAEVAMVDVTGLVERQLQIVPDPDKLAVLGLSIEDIENVLAQNNVEPGSKMCIRDRCSGTHLREERCPGAQRAETCRTG